MWTDVRNWAVVRKQKGENGSLRICIPGAAAEAANLSVAKDWGSQGSERLITWESLGALALGSSPATCTVHTDTALPCKELHFSFLPTLIPCPYICEKGTSNAPVGHCWGVYVPSYLKQPASNFTAGNFPVLRIVGDKEVWWGRWKGGSAVKNTGCSCRGCRFGSQHATVCNSSSRDSDALFWPPWVPGMDLVHL